ncbi:acyl-CoA thioesterase/bile acid-CoA:amino acid N-acyltransferase family protein [Streptomyces clavuligerus]|uniref:Palmitoyl-CoA hydrolase n=1 Tax=Streptomyces clavuligerus TaxID=1901 RepID=E2Q612_STRCL|nr:acyl-CoA thioesterase/bile acid-CoA:amino acid N-acyltransferase family protein [Streptomyces clavuligerus]ANW22125.1 palmitoyl-CoA hydrolase [Streptomyces clavuligerus]AXU16772.1 palmitoyl-CoA hydrolase [Streptomyces clavuligerus]EFG05172.1 Palmitoyl-CoA hydrolase [Streptomyces clavuligerus]MBY6306434.1 acyl-CoA thioesterase/BAAT N-terminal domain-containing protein [Streptomyces clavuligerus]QCS09532.1 palmitoyl-CoA hydrolase [Streptomyces clavuligerus]
MKRTRITGLPGTVVLALLVTACSGGSPSERADRPAVITVDRESALVDEAVTIRVSGLRAGEKVTVTAETDDAGGVTWTGRATFTADRTGAVDPARAKPSAGTYRAADAMGLFWSMEPEQGSAAASVFVSDVLQRPVDTVRVTARAEGRPDAHRDLARRWTAEGVESRVLRLTDDKVAGRLFLPPDGRARRAPVLVFGGSEGGVGGIGAAALLASRGHAALALCYFGCPGLPDTLKEVPLEYFATAARTLGRLSGDGQERMAVMGTSRGSEAAQHLAQNHPELIRDAVVYGPGDRYHQGFPDGTRPAWTLRDRPVRPGPIALDRVRGTVLAIAGGEDALWDAAEMSAAIARRSGESGRHRALIYPEAGHAVGSYPYVPAGTEVVHPVDKVSFSLGGTRAADAHARADAWPQVLSLIGR